MTTHTLYDLYAAQRDSLVEQLRSLTPAQAETAVPTCPGWTVKDVVSHVSGLVAEKLADVPPPLGSDVATARQVSDRAGMTLADVCDEWENNAGPFKAVATDEDPFIQPVLCDLVVHSHDIQEALDLPIAKDSAPLAFAADRYLGLLLDRASEQNIGLSVELSGLETRKSAGEPTLRLQATPFEFLSSVTARRTRAKVEALDWDGDPSELLDTVFAQYGPLQD